MGKVSGAFGLGMVVGPALGGWLAGGSTLAEASLSRPALAAACASALSALMILAFLPESRPAPADAAGEPRASARRDEAASAAAAAPGRAEEGLPPLVTLLLVVGFLVVFGMAMREAVFPLWGSHVLGLGASTLGMLYALSGATVALLQFTSMGTLTRRFGSYRLTLGASVLFAAGWSTLAIAHNLGAALFAVALTASATALFQTSMQNMLAELAPAARRGRIMGAYQSAGALARYVGQTSAGSFYGFLHPSAPFALGAVLMLPAAAVLISMRRRLPNAITRAAPASPAAPERSTR
jgi:MFS family permease